MLIWINAPHCLLGTDFKRTWTTLSVLSQRFSSYTWTYSLHTCNVCHVFYMFTKWSQMHFTFTSYSSCFLRSNDPHTEPNTADMVQSKEWRDSWRLSPSSAECSDHSMLRSRLAGNYVKHNLKTPYDVTPDTTILRCIWSTRPSFVNASTINRERHKD